MQAKPVLGDLPHTEHWLGRALQRVQPYVAPILIQKMPPSTSLTPVAQPAPAPLPSSTAPQGTGNHVKLIDLIAALLALAAWLVCWFAGHHCGANRQRLERRHQNGGGSKHGGHRVY